MCCSSGTSRGERKLIPTTEDDFLRRLQCGGGYRQLIEKQCPGELENGQGMYFVFVKPETKTRGGLSAKTYVTSLVTSKQFRHLSETGRYPFTSPLEAVLCEDVAQSMYSQLVCGLVQRAEVERMGCVFPSSFLRVVKLLCERWGQLAEDIRQRKLVSGVVRDAKLRNVVEAMLAASDGAGPAAAAQIEIECRKESSWEGILRRLWPRAKYVEAIVTGAMAQYVPALEFYAGGLPIVSCPYGCSECYCGFNLTPFCSTASVCYTLLPNLAFFEFLPLSEEAAPSKLVELANVQVGTEYELVVTTYAGLYRYRVGDVLKVQGFYNKAPQFSFVRRRNAALTIDVDKTDEDTLQRAVMAAASMHLDAIGCRLAEFSSYADVSTIPGHYVLFWELSCSASGASSPSAIANGAVTDSIFSSPTSPLPECAVLEECCMTVENCLDSVYRQCRVQDSSIGPLEIRLVQSGSFDALMDYCVARGASVNQYKAPLCIKFTPLVDLLNSRVTHSFFSPKCPDWTPKNA